MQAFLRMVFACAALAASALASAATTFWVSPAGNDANAGTESAPFRTLEHATDVVAATDADVTVYIADGTYRLTRPLVFGARAHEVALRAMPGAKPVVSGAMRVERWTLYDKARNIYRATVGNVDSRQLYVNGRRATRARTQLAGGNLPAGFLPSPTLPKDAAARPYVIGGGIRFLPTPLNPAAWRDPAKWRHPRDVEAVLRTQWKMMSVPIDRVTPSSGKQPGLLVLRQPGWTNANLYFGTKPASCEPDAPSIWSFWQVTEFANAYEFLDEPGEWYLDRSEGALYYMPRRGEDLATADVELPLRETLVEAHGTPAAPVTNLRFEGLTFAYATWLGPSGDDGYVSDQSGFRVVGTGHLPNVTGHVRDVTRTPGNLSFRYAQHITFRNDRFEHLGAVALDLGSGSQHAEVDRNTFSDISAAAIQLGGVAADDARPPQPSQATRHNRITDNLIVQVGRDYVDSAAIFAGFTADTEIRHNTISDVGWSGIAIGWGWGLLDAGMYPGIGCAQSGEWGTYTTPTVNSGNRIAQNRISHFLQKLWDGGAIYSTGQQGTSASDPLVIEGNVADHKESGSGGNTFYTDGGSRYVVLRGNVSYGNPIGRVAFGPPPQAGDPLPYPASPSMLNFVPYGGDSGGCRTYGDIRFENNYWMEGLIPPEFVLGALELLLSRLLHIHPPADFYSAEGFFDICPYTQGGVSYPTNLTYAGNHDIVGVWEVPKSILDSAGVQP